MAKLHPLYIAAQKEREKKEQEKQQNGLVDKIVQNNKNNQSIQSNPSDKVEQSNKGRVETPAPTQKENLHPLYRAAQKEREQRGAEQTRNTSDVVVPRNATPVADKSKPNNGYTIDAIRQNLDDSYMRVDTASKLLNNSVDAVTESSAVLEDFFKKYNATGDDIELKMATAYGAVQDENGTLLFEDEESYNACMNELKVLEGLYAQFNADYDQYNTLMEQYNVEEDKYNEWSKLAENYQPRDANFWDLTFRSIKQGWHNADYGLESFNEMWGFENNADEKKDLLSSEEYQFEPKGWLGTAVSGAANQTGQFFRQLLDPQTISATTAAAGAAAVAGQLGPQIALPEEVVSVPAAAYAGYKVGSAMTNFEIEAGLAYQEMLEVGVSEETARIIATGVGTGSAALEGLQIDEMVKGLKVLENKKTYKSTFDLLLDILKKRAPGVFNQVVQEVAQEGVTIVGTEVGSHIDKGEAAYTVPEIAKRLGETALSSTLTFGLMDAPGATMNIAGNVSNINRYGKIGNEYKKFADVDDIIAEGLSFYETSEAYQIATELQAKQNAGETITDAELGRAVAANQQAVRKKLYDAEVDSDPQETLEELARETVAERNGAAQSEDMGQETSAQRASVPYNVMSMENPVRQNVMAAKRDLKKWTGYGDAGQKAFEQILESGNQTPEQVRSQFQTSYELGRLGTPRKSVNLASGLQERAFTAGYQDYLVDREKDENKKFSVSKEAGFDRTGAPADVTDTQAEILDMLAKNMGSKSYFDGDQDFNAEIQSDGTVRYSTTFNREILDDNGNVVKTLTAVDHALHELGAHRAMQVAPESTRAFVNKFYAYKMEGMPSTVGTLAEQKQEQYGGQKVALTTDKAFEEVIANEIFPTLYRSNEQELVAGLRRAFGGNTEEVRQGARTFRDVLNDMWRKIKEFAAKLRKKGDIAGAKDAEQAAATVRELRDMFEAILKEVSDKVKAAEANGETATKNTAQVSGEVQNNLKGKSFQEDKYFARQMDKWAELTDGTRVKVGVVQTGSALNRVGLPASGMYFDVGKIKKSMGKHSDHLTPSVLKGIPDLLNDPIVITQYTGPNGDIKNTVSVYGNLFVDGKPVVVGIVMNRDSSGRNIINNIRTIHVRSNFAKQITDANTLYLNENKKKTLKWFHDCGISSVPLAGTKFGVIRSIAFEAEIVNTEETQKSLKVTDKKTLDFLNEQIERGEYDPVKNPNGGYIKVYRSFQVIGGKLYAPMNAVDRDTDGKNHRLGYNSQYRVWEMATESPEIAQRYMDANPDAPYAKFDLDGVDNKTGGVAYNPYLHASNLVLNDQFSAAYRRNLITVECYVPVSEANGAYKAKYAKDATGWVEWKPGGVAGKLMKQKPEYTRKLFVSRYMLPVREVKAPELASMYKEYLDGTNIKVPWNVVTPELRRELVKAGVGIDYKDVYQSTDKKTGEKKYAKFDEVFPGERQYSLKDEDYMKAVESGDMETAQRLVDEAAKAAGFPAKLYHGTPQFGFTRTDVSKSDDGISFFATDSLEVAQTYSGKSAVKQVADDAHDDIEAIEEAFRDKQTDLCEYINRVAGYQSYIGYDAFNKYWEDAASGTESMDVLRDEFYEEVETIIQELFPYSEYYERMNEEDADQDELYEQFAESDEVQRIYSASNDLEFILRAARADNSGNYQLYANTDNLFELDAKSKSWAQIPFDEYDTNGFHPYVNTRQAAAYAKYKGFAGVKISNVFDDGGRSAKHQRTPATVYIFFNPQQQVKSADPVTYDDSGNVIPLSKRFNTENDDIRYSLKDSSGRELTKEQTDYFKNSKIRDKKGNLKVVYHGSGAKFTKFSYDFMSSHGSSEGQGFYFTDKKEMAQGYEQDGGQLLEGYLNITKPLSDSKVTIKKAELTKLLKAVDPTGDDVIINYDPSGGMGYPSKTWYNRALAGTVAQMMEYNESDSEILADIANSGAGSEMVLQKVRELLGYDGYIVEGKYDDAAVYVAFTSEQFKNADNLNPTSDPDIRYSLKNQEDLMRQNAKLKEVNQELRDQFKTTKFAKVDKKALRQFAKQLLKDYQSGADIDETLDALDSVFTYIANGENGETAVWEVAYERAYEAAVSILSNSSTLNDELFQAYKQLRDDLKNTGITIDKKYDHDLIGYESISEFRRANFGRIKIVNDGTPVDMMYQELAWRYPEFFYEGTYSNQADQLSHIAEVLDSLQPTEVNPYSSNMRESATWLANDIMERYFELPQAKPTFADKAQQKLTKQVIKDHEKMERLREQKNERIASLIEERREKVKEVARKEKDKRDQKVREIKDRYKAKEAKMSESRKASILRERILRHVQDMSQTLLRPSDNRHIPENLRKPVAAVLDAINLESQFTVDPETGKRQKNKPGDPTNRTKAFNDLRKAYQDIIADDGTDIVVDPAMEAMLDLVISLHDVKLADMNLAQLHTVWDVLRVVEHTIHTAGKLLSESKYERTVEWASAMANDTATRRSKRGGKAGAIRIDMENPYTFFSHYGESGKAVFRMLRDAQDKQQTMVEEVRKKVRSIVDPKTVRKLEKETAVFTTEHGDKLTLTTAQIMDIYLLTKRQQAHDHLLKGGIVQPEVKSKNIKRGTDAILLSAADLSEIVGTLDSNQREIANKLQEMTRTTLADYGNEASMKAYGYKKFTGNDYWPIKSAREGVHSNVEKGGNNTRSIKNIGLAKSVMPHANNPLDVGGVFQTFASHAADMTDYAAWLCPMEDANRLFNFQFRDDLGQRTGKTIKGLLDRVGGKGAQQYWHNLMEDIQNGIKSQADNTMINPINKIIGNVRGASVGANIRVIVQQPTAILRAAAVLNPLDMTKGLAAGGGWKKAVQHSPIAQRKNMGGFDISSPAQMNEILYDSQTPLQRFNNAMMWGAGKADSITWGRIWNACEWAVKRDRKDLAPRSDEFYEAVNELFTEVVDQSQVVDGVLQRSQLMRSNNALLNQATAFMGEPTMTMNMMLRAYDGLVNETDKRKRGKAIKVFGRTAMALLVTNAVNAVMQSFVDAWRDDEDDEYWKKLKNAFFGVTDEEETAWEKAMAAVLEGNLGSSLNPAGYVPFAKDILSILQGYNVTRADADVMGDIINATTTFIESVGGDGKRTIAYATKNLAQQVGKVFGISAPNILRDVWGIVRTIALETGNIPLQYEMEKAIYKIDNDGNTGLFVDILYKAYTTEKEAYQHIYDDMKASGFNMDKIQTQMESRMKKEQGVTKVENLEQRYLHPDEQRTYDSKLKSVSNSSLWRSASAKQKEDVEAQLYNLSVMNSDGEKLQEKIDEGKPYGLTETEYLLYDLALSMVDQPNKSGEMGGTPTNAEKAAAIAKVGGFGNGEIAYLWDTESGYEVYAAGLDMRTYVERLGSGDSVNAEKLIEADGVVGEDNYYDFLDMLNEYDRPTESGKLGTFTQDEATAAISAMPGLTNSQRAWLWQSVNKGWKEKNNPWK